MHAELIFKNGPLDGMTFRARTNQSLTVGRSPRSKLTIDHYQVSRNHAIVELREQALYVTDLGSSNGTTVNGEALTPREATPVADGDQVGFAGQFLQVRLVQHTTTARRSRDLYRRLDAPQLPEGKYQLLSYLGKGASGRVWSALRRTDAQPVAIKILTGRDYASNAQLARFQQEAEVCCSVSHPNIVEVHEFVLEPKQAYIVMELVHGPSLLSVLTKRKKLSFSAALLYGEQLASALSALQQAHIVHRDVKPANILLHPRTGVKLVDFGIAKLLGSEALQTGTGIGMGSLNFVSPEQATEARSVDHRADLYALGACLYAMLAGRTPLELTNSPGQMQEAIQRLEEERPEPLSSVRIGCTKALSDLVASLLETSRDDRPDSAAEVEQALREIRETSYAEPTRRAGPDRETGTYHPAP